MVLTLLITTVFRMIVIPVQFQDEEFNTTREQQQVLVSDAAAYFNRQFAGQREFRFDLAPPVTLSHPLAWYGTNYSDRKDIRVHEAVREACNQLHSQIDFSRYDNDGDGQVDNIYLLAAGLGENDGGGETAFWPQQGRLSVRGNAFSLEGKRVDGYAVCHEGSLGVFCHEFGHVLGLADLYDNSGQADASRNGLRGSSLMDGGCLQDPLPDFTAVEYDQLGLDRCDPLSAGHHHLLPLRTGGRYLKADTERNGEYFLFECRADALHIYHIDRSDNPAGFSPLHGRTLSARERWEVGMVNNAPEHPCARLIPADPSATGLSGVPFPQAGFNSFGSDTPSAFRSWSGNSPGLALTNFRTDDDGSIEFDVIEPIVLQETVLFQDAAILRWKVSPGLEDLRGIELSWTDGKQRGTLQLGPDTRSHTLEGLLPQTAYAFSLLLLTSDADRYSISGSFVTKMYRSGTYPYIYLSGTARNTDGSFPPGSKIPLRVYNASDVLTIRWTLDSIPITPEADGFYTLQRSGVLRAQIFYNDGSTETLLKQITVL